MQSPFFVKIVLLQNTLATPKLMGELDPWKLIGEASLMVKFVLAALVVMSIVSWFVVGLKLAQLSRVGFHTRRFLTLFWGSSERNMSWSQQRLDAIYGQLMLAKRSPLARVFHAGYLELSRHSEREREAQPTEMRIHEMENIERAMRRASLLEVTRLESMVSFLATTGSTAPFIGLFGTVWGIMFAITDLHRQSLPVVSQQIAEALIATAIGLAAAIPAVMAYNYFTRRLRILEGELDAFANDYLIVLQRCLLES